MLTAKLFANINSQAVQLPEENTWETFLEGISGFTDDYIQIMDKRSDDVPNEREML
ncbi:MAG: hypothetical protein NC177_17060 [Ruminococcus flavefaciens]|nr:hypothetical protein [Ruminococcus flavefaciens]